MVHGITAYPPGSSRLPSARVSVAETTSAREWPSPERSSTCRTSRRMPTRRARWPRHQHVCLPPCKWPAATRPRRTRSPWPSSIYAPLKRSLKPKNGFAFVYNVKQVSSRNAQQVTVTCVCCNQSFSSTGSSNIVTHLISCPVCPREIRDGFKELRNASGSKSAAKRKAVVLFTRARPSSRSPRPSALPSSPRPRPYPSRRTAGRCSCERPAHVT